MSIAIIVILVFAVVLSILAIISNEVMNNAIKHFKEKF